MSDNELIAEFMGLQIQHVDFDLSEPRMYVRGVWRKAEYDTSWDWLMPVVEKIWQQPDGHQKLACQDLLMMTLPCANHPDSYKAVVEFIKWYNSQPKPQ